MNTFAYRKREIFWRCINPQLDGTRKIPILWTDITQLCDLTSLFFFYFWYSDFSNVEQCISVGVYILSHCYVVKVIFRHCFSHYFRDVRLQIVKLRKNGSSRFGRANKSIKSAKTNQKIFDLMFSLYNICLLAILHTCLRRSSSTLLRVSSSFLAASASAAA